MSKEGLKRGVVCAVVLFAALFMLWGRVIERRGEAQAQGEKTVGQTGKNIQVLKDLPQSQLGPEMNFISASLGVHCDFCHVQSGKDPKTGNPIWNWESDDKEEKKTARDMMRMVLSVNGGNFGLSRGTVTCYTCHRGQTHPQGLPTLPIAEPAHTPGPGMTPPPGGPVTPGAPDAHGGPGGARPEQPTVQQVYDKYLAAVGGQAAVAKFQTQVMKGTIAQSQNRNSTFEVTTKSPDKYLLVMETPQGQMRRALNGATGWMAGPRGTRAFGASELVDARRAADLAGVVKFTPSSTMRVIGRRKLNDRDMIIVVDRPSETVQRRYFFDAETGLLTRIVTLTDALLNNLPEQVDFEDYRDVDGAKIPFVVKVATVEPFNSYTRTLTDVRHGVTVEDKLFDMPPATPAPAATPRP